MEKIYTQGTQIFPKHMITTDSKIGITCLLMVQLSKITENNSSPPKGKYLGCYFCHSGDLVRNSYSSSEKEYYDIRKIIIPFVIFLLFKKFFLIILPLVLIPCSVLS